VRPPLIWPIDGGDEEQEEDEDMKMYVSMYMFLGVFLDSDCHDGRQEGKQREIRLKLLAELRQTR